MKVLLLAGEESGVLYANRLKALMPNDEVRGYEDYGFKVADLAVMGFVAVLKKIFYFLRVKRTMQRAIDEWRPDAVLTIDYPGMNLKLAAYAKSKGIRTVHVVCPQVWAWKKGRIPKIEASLDKLCCFFPFEPKYFKPGFAEFIGHPLAEGFAARDPKAYEKGLVALLPGSRLGEIERNLPTMMEALSRLPDVRAIIPAANERAERAINRVLTSLRTSQHLNLSTSQQLTVQLGGARELLLRAECAVVASGTATLEAGLARCPTVLVYKVDAFFAWFARKMIKEIRHIGLVNIIWEKAGEPGSEPMPELLQEAFTADAVANLLTRWREDPVARAEAICRLDETVRLLDGEGNSLDHVVALLKA